MPTARHAIHKETTPLVTDGILLVNLGTPASPRVEDVRAYLAEFLSDPYVIDLPAPLRAVLLRAFILPFRPRRSATAYEKIWDAAGEATGSPLLHYSESLTRALVARLGGTPCELGMRYGSPSLADALARLADQGVTRLKLIGLYPQHADSTRTTSIEAVRQMMPAQMSLWIQPPFYDDRGYIRVQADVIRRNLPARWDHLLFSYHGLPERHLIRADPTGNHCLRTPDCCEIPSGAHRTCYRHQVRETSRALAADLALPADRWSESYQSRLGRLPWLQPATDEVLAALPGKGIRHLVVACPAFVADNLETLEEIGMAGRSRFL